MPAPSTTSGNGQPERRAASTAVDTDAQQLGTVYARAFLGAAENAGKTAEFVAELESFVADVLDGNPSMEHVLSSQMVSAENKLDLLERGLRSQASRLFLNCLKVLATHERLGCVRAVSRAVQQQYNEMQGRVDVQVVTATPLDDIAADRLTKRLREMLDSEPNVVRVTDPDLIGGVVLRVGDTVYDGSIAAQLRHLRAKMIDRSIHEIQSRRDRFGDPAGN